MNEIKEKSHLYKCIEKKSDSNFDFFGYNLQIDSNMYQNTEQIEDKNMKASYKLFLINKRVLDKE